MSHQRRTTIRVEERLLQQAKSEAARRGETLSALVEQGLRLVLAQPASSSTRPRVLLPVCRAGGGTLPGVDLNDGASLQDILDGL